MRVPFVVLAAAVAVAPAFAEEPTWLFKPGQTFTYEAKTYFHYTTVGLTVAGGGGTTSGGGGGGATTPGGGGNCGC